MRITPAVAVATGLLLVACGAGSDGADDADATPTSAAPTSASQDHLDAWMVNDTGAVAAVIGDGVAVDVQAVETVEVEGVRYVSVTATGLPDYEHTLTEADVEALTGRPLASRDFVTGAATVSPGDTVAFGQDIGYRSTGCEDTDGSGYGYWPPGPACPVAQDYDQVLIPLDPVPATGEHTATGLGAIGLWVNGVAIFNWGDGQSYEGAGVWQTLAPVAESYDLDICPGHSAGGQYHHHSDPTCLADELGDVGHGHSPIYGFAADGYPVYGPWVAEGVLARSSWVVRDYDDPDSPTGCGEVGVRSCLLVDQTDPSAGVVDAPSAGPPTDGTVTSLSGNTFATTAGFYMQDHYYDASLDDGSLPALDRYNGHEHDGLGYHYHVTRAAADDGTLVDVFPYYIGVEFAGDLQGGTVTAAGGAGGRPGGGPRPGG